MSAWSSLQVLLLHLQSKDRWIVLRFEGERDVVCLYTSALCWTCILAGYVFQQTSNASLQWQHWLWRLLTNCHVYNLHLFASFKDDAKASECCEGWLYKQKYNRTSASHCLRVDINVIQTVVRQALNKHVFIPVVQLADIKKTLELVQPTNTPTFWEKTVVKIGIIKIFYDLFANDDSLTYHFCFLWWDLYHTKIFLFCLKWSFFWTQALLQYTEQTGEGTVECVFTCKLGWQLGRRCFCSKHAILHRLK